MRIKHRRYRLHPFGFGCYYGGVQPRRELPIRQRPSGLRRFLRVGAQTLTNTRRFLLRALRDGIQVFTGVLALSDLLSNAGRNTTRAQVLLMISAGITALGDALSFARWLRNNAPDYEEAIYQLSEEIRSLQELLAGRIRFLNDNEPPTPEEAGVIFANLASERGEPDDIADIGGEAVRHAMASGESLARAISRGSQAILEERRRQGLPLTGYGYYGGSLGTATTAPTLEDLATFFDWLKPIFKQGYEMLSTMQGGAIANNEIRDFCLKGAQQAWTIEEFDRAMMWLMWEKGEPGYPRPQFNPPPGYLAKSNLHADTNLQLYNTFLDRAIKKYLYPNNPNYPGTTIPLYYVKFPFKYKEELLDYPAEELAKVARKEALFDMWWRQNGFIPQFKRRKGFYGNGYNRYGRRKATRPKKLLYSGYDAPYGGRIGYSRGLNLYDGFDAPFGSKNGGSSNVPPPGVPGVPPPGLPLLGLPQIRGVPQPPPLPPGIVLPPPPPPGIVLPPPIPDLDSYLPPPVIMPDPGPIPPPQIPDYLSLQLFTGNPDGSASIPSGVIGYHINGEGPFQFIVLDRNKYGFGFGNSREGELALIGGNILKKLFNIGKNVVGKVYTKAKKLLS